MLNPCSDWCSVDSSRLPVFLVGPCQQNTHWFIVPNCSEVQGSQRPTCAQIAATCPRCVQRTLQTRPKHRRVPLNLDLWDEPMLIYIYISYSYICYIYKGYVQTNISMYICVDMYLCTYLHMCTCSHVDPSMYTCVHQCTCVRMHVHDSYVNAPIWVKPCKVPKYSGVCIHIHMYIYIL